MTETELIGEIKVRAHELSRRTTMWQYFFEQNTRDAMQLMLEEDAQRRLAGRATGLPDPELLPLATVEAVKAAQDAVGFHFPTLLERLWIEVANGGFGPGYGLFGVEGGLADDDMALTTAPYCLASLETGLMPEPSDSAGGTSEADGPAEFAPWPEKLVPICEWGCQHLSAIDCATPEGQMVDLVEGFERKPKRMTFVQWMEAWVSGVELWPW